MKYNFVVILKNEQDKVKQIRQLSEFEPDISVSDEGWIALAGSFKEQDIKNFEYYPLSEDWQTKSGWKDRPL